MQLNESSILMRKDIIMENTASIGADALLRCKGF
jgi:hypothetical protein